MRNLLALLFSFQGRIGRRPWWLAQIGLILVYGSVFGAWCGESDQMDGVTWAILLPGIWIDLATSAKRYHDLNRSGWRQLLCLIPIVGELWVTIELGFLSGSPLPNPYGYPGVCGRASMTSRGRCDRDIP